MATVIDFSGRPPSAESVKAAGYAGAVRYISDDRTGGSMPGKPLTKAEVDDYRAHGLGIAIVSQYGKDKDSDVLRGTKGGEADARLADERLTALGLAGWPVFFAVDFDITLKQWNTLVVEYFRAACRVLGRDRVGIYGHSRVLAWAVQDGVVGDAGGGRHLCWQTKAWSRGVRAPEAVLYQGRFNIAHPGGPVLDVNDVIGDYWGQRPPETTPAPPPPADAGGDLRKYLTVQPDIVKLMNKHFTPGRGGKKIRFIVRHHLAGVGDVGDVWRWWQTRQASAHYVVQNDGRVGQLVWDRDTAWASLSANPESIAIEHANSAGAGADYPISDTVIREGARWAAALCLFYGLGKPEFGTTIRDHREFGATSCPHHLAKGGRYHDAWMAEARSFYDRLVAAKAGNALAPRPPVEDTPAPPVVGGGQHAAPEPGPGESMRLDTPVETFVDGGGLTAPLWHFIMHADRNAFDALTEVRALRKDIAALSERLGDDAANAD